MELKTLAEAPIAQGTRVLLRLDVNEPVDGEGNPTDTFRLRRALPTIKFLADKGARTTVVGHLGRQGESLRGVAAALARLAAPTPIEFFDGTLAQAAGREVAPGEFLMLENIRRHEGEETDDPALTKSLAQLGDVFVMDAFADAHRAHASIVGVAGLLPGFAGLLVAEEVARLSQALQPPPQSVAIVGGAKFETKEPLIIKLLGLYGRVLIGGALANDFLKARGENVAASKTSNTPVPPELARDERIALPVDAVFKDGLEPHAAPIAEIGNDEQMLDAGPETIAAWSDIIAAAPLVLWNGPLGVYEDGFVDGTNGLARAIVAHCEKTGAQALVGGGDTIAALEGISFDQEKIFRSTGGGAMLQFLAEGTLPGLQALQK